jgi:hypothetical protein
MIKNIKLPAPQLSQLKEVNVKLDMTGRHYRLLATSQNELPEEVILSITKDLLQEDATKLTLNEIRYIFTLIKINSLENEYKVRVMCKNYNPKTKKTCGEINDIQVALSDSDLNKTPEDYKVPEIEFCYEEEKPETFYVMPPTIDTEIALMKLFTIERNKDTSVFTDLNESMDYTLCLALLHLVDRYGERMIKQFSSIEDILKFTDINTYAATGKLINLMNEVESFGVQNKIYECTCKECGSKLSYQIPLLNGLVSGY